MIDWENTGFYTAFLQMKPGDKKAPLGQYTKNDENHNTLEQVKKLNRFMGVLAPDTILLDADSEPHSDNLLKLIQGENLSCLLTTRDGGRGNHALFFDSDGLIKQGGTGLTLACGIVVDIKAGRKNGLECLKWDGVEREIIHDVAPYQQLPKYLTPVSTRVDFANLGEGDGRNQALFNYILTLQTAGFEMEEARACIRLMNKYVLKSPLPGDELEIVLRDAAFQKPIFFKGSAFLHDKFAEYIRNTHHVKRLSGRLHTYSSGVYTPDIQVLKRLMISEIPSLKKAQISEVLERIDTLCEPVKQSSVSLIAFRNGNLNIDTGEISECSPDVVITNRIPWDYNTNAYDELMDRTLDKICCQDIEIRTLIEEMVGACFYRSNDVGSGKAFMLTGEKANGKSTLLKVIQTLLGEDNITALDFKNVDDRFSTGSLFGKLANIGDDISHEYKNDTSTFKKLVTGEKVRGEFKGQDEFFFIPYATQIFSVNSTPKTNDKTGAVLRRWEIIPFNAMFSETDTDYDPLIARKLQQQQAIEYLIRLGVEGLKRVLKNGKFTKSAKVEEAKEEYDRENNPIKAFVDEIGIENIENEPTDRVYGEFECFCLKNGFKGVFNKINFSKQLKTHFEITTKSATVNGKSIRIYVKSDTK